MVEPPAIVHHAHQQCGDAAFDEERGDGATPPERGEFTANPLRSLAAAAPPPHSAAAARNPLKVAPERPPSSSAPRSAPGAQRRSLQRRPHVTRSLEALLAHVPWRSSRLGVHATLRITCLTPWQAKCWLRALPWRRRIPSSLLFNDGHEQFNQRRPADCRLR